MDVGFHLCIDDWCFQKGTKEQYTKCKRQAKMEEPVIAQQLGMDLQLVVALQNIQAIILQLGANNYFLLQYMPALQHTILR